MKLELYGALERCPECNNLKRYLDGKYTLYNFMDVDQYPETRQELNIKRIPVLILRGFDGLEVGRVTAFNESTKEYIDKLLEAI